jgi:hypothetical protein
VVDCPTGPRTCANRANESARPEAEPLPTQPLREPHQISVKILAYKSLAQILQSHDPVGGWFLRYSEYLAVNAIPYLLPFVVAIRLHREVREHIFQWAAPVAASAPQAPNRNRDAKRGNRKRIAAKRN